MGSFKQANELMLWEEGIIQNNKLLLPMPCQLNSFLIASNLGEACLLSKIQKAWILRLSAPQLPGPVDLRGEVLIVVLDHLISSQNISRSALSWQKHCVKVCGQSLESIGQCKGYIAGKALESVYIIGGVLLSLSSLYHQAPW